MLRRCKVGTDARAERIPRHHQIVRELERAIEVENEVFGQGKIERRRAAALEIDVAHPPDQFTGVVLVVGQGRGDAVVDDVDDTADGAGAVEERGGATDHFDGLRGQWLDAGLVIGREVAHVENLRAVVEHAHPVIRLLKALIGRIRVFGYTATEVK